MLDVQLSEKNLMSATNNSLSGQHSITSDMSRRQEGKECIIMETFTPCSIKPLSLLRKRKSSTVGFQVPIKKKISKDKLTLCAQNIQPFMSSKMLEAESILNDLGSPDYLKMSWILKLRQSLCPTKTDFVGLDLNLLSGFANKEAQKSWYITMIKEKDQMNLNSPKTFWQSATFSSQKEMVKKQLEIEKQPKTLKTRLCHLNLSPRQAKLFRKWFGAYRFVYNKCVEIHSEFKSQKEKRAYILNGSSPLKQQFPWLTEFPYDLLDEAIRDFMKAVKTCHTLLKKQKIKFFKIAFKSRKSPSQSVGMLKKHWHLGTPFPKWWKAQDVEPLRLTKDTKITQDTRIVYKKNVSKYFIVVTCKDALKSLENQEDFSICAVDPGIRTFCTSFSMSRDKKVEAYHGHEAWKVLEKLSLKISKISKVRSKVFKSKKVFKKKYKTLKSLKSRQGKLRWRLKNLVDQLHYGTIKDLMKNNVIFLPEFQTSQMIKKSRGSLSKKTVRATLNLRHYQFRQRLVNKVAGNKDVKLFVTGERYTTQTCSNCFKTSPGQKGEVFKCSNNSCGVWLSRDLNAARNILLQNSLKFYEWVESA